MMTSARAYVDADVVVMTSAMMSVSDPVACGAREVDRKSVV